MLARRFSIVCLLTMIFGMAFAGLVARHEGQAQASARSADFRCIVDRVC